MSSGERTRRGVLPRAAAIAAALALLAGAPFAAPVEVPRIEAPVGSGSASAAPAAAGAIVAPALSASAPTLAPSAAPAALLAPAALPSAVSLAPAAVAAAPAPAAVAPALAPAPNAAPSARFGSGSPSRAPGGFGKRVLPPARDEPAAASPAADAQAWSQSSVLFDLAAERPDAPAVVAADLPSNPAGKVLGKLRLAAARGEGPGAIPGMARAEWVEPAGRGNSGESTKVRIDGKLWFMKRLGHSPDPGIAATPVETRARNEAGVAEVLRSDPQLGRSFSVAPRLSVFRDGKDVFVLSEGLPAVGDGESRRQELSPAQRADAALIQLVLGVGDMHGGDVLPLSGGGFGLVDFEKLSRAPMEKASAREIDEQVMMKNYPLVDRLSANDPALYRARFASWKADYDAGGRARMDASLARAGWTRPEREAYLAAVDRNAATYLERLQPYLDYGNEWHRRILEARAEAARKKPEAKGGFLGGLFGGKR